MVSFWLLPIITVLTFFLIFLCLFFLVPALILGLLLLASLVLGFFFNLGLSLAFGYAVTFPRVIGLGIILVIIGLITGGNGSEVEVNA